MNRAYARMIAEYPLAEAGESVEIEYKFQCPEYLRLRDKYALSQFSGAGDWEKIRRLLLWVNAHVTHAGDYDNSDPQDSLSLLDLAFDTGYGINCLAMSILLSECLLAVGVWARVVYMMPCEAEDGDNHVVVEAFVAEWGKWVMVDPTYGSYCINSQGTVLNLCEIRECVGRDEKYSFSKNLCYNGEAVTDIEDLKEYYAKNLFFFRCSSRQGYGEHRGFCDLLGVAPSGFDIRKRMLENLDYRISVYGRFPFFERWRAHEASLQNRCIGTELFYKAPEKVC